MRSKAELRSRCLTKFCRGKTFAHHHSPFCAKCRSRHYREAHPIKNAFRQLRCRAKERGKTFSLTLDQYEKFCRETGYDKLKGKHKYSLSIHRIDNNRGYEMSNIAAITLSLNSKLQFSSMPGYLRAEMEECIKRGIDKQPHE